MKSTEKILLITSEFPPQPGGIGNHAWHLAKSFQQNKMDVQVISDQRSGEGEEEVKFDAQQEFKIFRIKRRKVLAFSYLNRILKAVQLTRKNEVILLSGKFSIWVGGLLSLLFTRKFVAVLHGSEVLLPSKYQKKYTDFCLKRFDELIAVSNYTKSLVNGLQLQNITVIPNGFEISKYAQTPKQLNIPPLNLITVGNVTPRKGQHNIIKALPLIKQKFPSVTYHMVGIPTTKDKLVSLAKSLEVEDCLVFHGRVSEEKKMALLEQASIFMMLSEHTAEGDVEGFGIAILEGNALGLPGIGAKGCGIEDAIKNHQSGILVEAQKEDQILEAIHEIIGDYTSYSLQAIDWTRNFTWDKIIKEYLKVVQ
ncbi:phosphatidylinositol alpha-1,6-mannosyltransferase [Mesonia phycicola]|uniref:Phosphatidylinositol alpha-1,6-mannosyltransferase n=1 Tax=Mesonia phycicola TaxID=579105 RepID=A0A1M6ALR3_9FLAO|nr:glycosyltransferase family 4 protein [Mesonia phycicola]SHI37395.1 phosphatidylinositol alpha-1,6-mannosyltransferase [Mesonia phycicola]